MKFEPKDLWMQAMAGGLKAAFLDEMVGYKTVNGTNPQHFLVPEWMYVVSRICLEGYAEPMFAGIPLAPYDSDRVIATGQYLPDGGPIPGLTEAQFQTMMGTYRTWSDDAAPSG